MASICLISLNYAPEPIGIGPFSQGWAEVLVRRGHAVQVICGVPYYPAWKAMEGYREPFAQAVENGVQVMRVPHHIPGAPGTVGRLRHYATFAMNAYRGVGKLGPAFAPEAVIAIAPALLSAPVALQLAKTHRALSWLHIQDFEVEAALATGLLPGWAARLGAGFENGILSRFDRLSSISPRMIEKAAAKADGSPVVHELRNWADVEVGAMTTDGERLRRELDLPDGLLALYSGNLARKQGIGLLLEAANAMQSRPDLHFVICGDGPARAEVEQAAQDLPNLHFRPLQPRARLAELLAMASFHLLPQIAGAADLVLPSKLANMLASGRPVVATANSGTSLAGEVEGCGIVVPAGQVVEFEQAIIRLADDDGLRKTLGQAARARAVERWSKASLLERFAGALEAALEEAGQ
ncbi:WcaI family glycosyltransferase [Parerythrobacter aestuarii]|uniref:WcaI family glycosyltransferase n=1 Tax=Parerythrobacter aestuarii TaxID=3020909 RepID=UPI0024DE7C54|nr:WcaI family glycosyltransferase [Parerythrobacter aestuarii]